MNTQRQVVVLAGVLLLVCGQAWSGASRNADLTEQECAPAWCCRRWEGGRHRRDSEWQSMPAAEWSGCPRAYTASRSRLSSSWTRSATRPSAATACADRHGRARTRAQVRGHAFQVGRSGGLRRQCLGAAAHAAGGWTGHRRRSSRGRRHRGRRHDGADSHPAPHPRVPCTASTWSAATATSSSRTATSTRIAAWASSTTTSACTSRTSSAAISATTTAAASCPARATFAISTSPAATSRVTWAATRRPRPTS